jgi:hypothetical protein
VGFAAATDADSACLRTGAFLRGAAALGAAFACGFVVRFAAGAPALELRLPTFVAFFFFFAAIVPFIIRYRDR